MEKYFSKLEKIAEEAKVIQSEPGDNINIIKIIIVPEKHIIQT